MGVNGMDDKYYHTSLRRMAVVCYIHQLKDDLTMDLGTMWDKKVLTMYVPMLKIVKDNWDKLKLYRFLHQEIYPLAFLDWMHDQYIEHKESASYVRINYKRAETTQYKYYIIDIDNNDSCVLYYFLREDQVFSVMQLVNQLMFPTKTAILYYDKFDTGMGNSQIKEVLNGKTSNSSS